MKLSEDPTIPALEGWMKLADAGEILGLTRQYVFRLATKKGFKTICRIGTGSNAIFLVKEEEVRALASARTSEKNSEVVVDTGHPQTVE